MTTNITSSTPTLGAKFANQISNHLEQSFIRVTAAVVVVVVVVYLVDPV